MRLLVVSGRSDALQSAAALATACYAASTGSRVLLASVGPAHLLGALMGLTLGSRPLELEPNLAAMEISAREEIGQRWDTVRPNLRSGMVRRLSEVTGDELPSFPGMDVVSALMVVDRAVQSKRFDLVVFDGPGNESLLRALALPDTLRWFVRLFFGLDRGAGRSRSSQETAMIPMSLLSPSAVAPLQDLRVAMEYFRSRLDVATGTRVRMTLPIEELDLPLVRQSLAGFGLYGLEVDTLILRSNGNGVDEAARHYFAQGASKPRPDLLVHDLPLSPTDLLGWTARGAQLYGQRATGLSLQPVRADDEAIGLSSDQRELRLHVPFLDPNSLDIAVANEEVVIRIGQFRRHLLLPSLGSGGRLRARVEGEILRLWVE